MAGLATTNLLLGILAVVSVVEALAFIAILTAGIVLVRRAARAIDRFETRHVAPAAERVNAILDDVKGVTCAVKDETLRMQRLVRWGTGWMGRHDRSA